MKPSFNLIASAVIAGCLTPLTGARPMAMTQSDPASLGAKTEVVPLADIVIKNFQNERLGRIKDLGIDLGNGRIVEVLVVFDEVLGLGGKTVAVPPRALVPDLGGQGYRLNMSADVFKTAPAFGFSQWLAADRSERVAVAYRFFGQEPYFLLEGAAANTPDHPPQVALGEVTRSSNLLDLPVGNFQDEDLGQIWGLTYDIPNGRVLTVVVTGPGSFKTKRVIRHLAFSFNARHSALLLDESQGAFADEPRYVFTDAIFGDAVSYPDNFDLAPPPWAALRPASHSGEISSVIVPLEPEGHPVPPDQPATEPTPLPRSAAVPVAPASIKGPHPILFALAVLPHSQSAAINEPLVDLGSAAGFAVLAGSAITFAGAVGSTTITGDIGSFPTPTITGLTSVVLTGVNHAGDAVTQAAKNDLDTAYTVARGRAVSSTVDTELGSTTLTSNVYASAAGTFGITGTLTLDAQNDPSAVFIFQMASTLITAASSQVTLINGARADHVFWQVGSSATLGGLTSFVGTILANTSITLITGATVDGRLLALGGAVTLDSNALSLPDSSIPEPATTSLLIAGSLVLLVGARRVRRRRAARAAAFDQQINFHAFKDHPSCRRDLRARHLAQQRLGPICRPVRHDQSRVGDEPLRARRFRVRAL